ncbi:hypothetical protein RA272_30685, partial [Pseudomonas syringae pv. tagetis]|uniref:hypothetical protein n=1 Tax=Pseudomonas syringae group genomosp. 7 TaxID=251699 RepID=UPI0037705CC3
MPAATFNQTLTEHFTGPATIIPEAQAGEAVPPSPQAVPHPPVEDDYESWVWRRVTNSIARSMVDIPLEMRVIVC